MASPYTSGIGPSSAIVGWCFGHENDDLSQPHEDLSELVRHHMVKTWSDVLQ
jgi:hypothetical protein